MKRTIWALWAMTLALASLVAAGCGGGGGGSSTTPPPGGGSRQQAFVTSSSGRDMSTGYDHIFVRVFEVELQPVGGGAAVNIYDSDTGQVLDLAALNEGTGKFLALGGREVKNGTYNVEVKMSRDLTLFPTGATSGTAATFAPQFNDSTPGVSKLEIDGALTVAGPGKVIVDFRLGSWTFAAGVVTPAASLGDDDTTISDDDQLEGEFEGTVTALAGAAPNQTFVLDIGFGLRLPVATDSQTVIYNDSGADSPALADGQRVEAHGFYDAAGNRMIARNIRIEDGDDDDDGFVSIEGKLQNPNETAGTFKIKAESCEDFLPDDLLFNVTTTDQTVFHDSDGMVLTRGEFFAIAAAVPNTRVEARGTLDEANNTLAAAKVEIDRGDDGDDDREAGVSGPVSDIVAGASFRVTLQDWEGFSGDEGETILVEVDGQTKFKDADGQIVTSAAFFEALTDGRIVEVEGTFDGNSILAAKVRLEEREDDDPEGVSVCGYASNDDLSTGRFDVQLVDWDGFDADFGDTVTVQTDASKTRFVDVNGDEVSKEEFFGMLAEGTEVEVEGTLVGTTVAASFVKIFNDGGDDDDDDEDRP